MTPRALLDVTRAPWLAGVLAGAVLLGAVVPLHRHQAVATKFDLVEERVWLLPPVGALRVASLGFHAMAADTVWLLTVQYIGGHFMTDGRFPELRRLVEAVVGLDPHFVEAYTLGALFLNYSGPHVQASLDLLQRGYRANPGRWELPHDIARIYYLDLKDYAKALEWFQITDKIPGRPHYVPRFIARLYAATGRRETALELWEAMRDAATSDWVRDIADREIAKLERQPAAPPTSGGATKP